MALERGTYRWAGAILVWLAAMVPQGVLGREAIELDAAAQVNTLADQGEAWMDETGQATFEQVASGSLPVWQPTRANAIYSLNTQKALWFRFRAVATTEHDRWYLEVPYPSVNRVTLFAREPGGWSVREAGDSLAVADWPVPHRHPLLPLPTSHGEAREYLVRVSNPHSFSAPLNFVTEAYLGRGEQRTAFILGIYFGLAGLAIALAALFAVPLRDRAFALYALSVMLMSLTQAAMTGLAGLHLWPTWPWWNDVSAMVIPVLGVGSLLWFFGAVVSLPQRSPRLNVLMLVLAALSVPVAAGIMVVEPSYRFLLMVPYIGIASTGGLLIILWAVGRGDRYARWLLAGSVPVAVAAIFPLARTAGLIPVSFLTKHAMQIGIGLELPVLLMILMLRSQQRRDHIRRIQGLERIDPATGLINGQVFMERLGQMIGRSQRLKYRSAVLLVAITNLEAVRRDFGREAAEELPVRVAGRLMSGVRDIDSVARLDDTHFGILIEGPIRTEDLAAAAPRVVAQCLMPYKNRPLECVAQARVAQALVPADGTDAEKLVQEMEALLAAVPADSRRAVFPLRPAGVTA